MILGYLLSLCFIYSTGKSTEVGVSKYLPNELIKYYKKFVI